MFMIHCVLSSLFVWYFGLNPRNVFEFNLSLISTYSAIIGLISVCITSLLSNKDIFTKNNFFSWIILSLSPVVSCFIAHIFVQTEFYELIAIFLTKHYLNLYSLSLKPDLNNGAPGQGANPYAGPSQGVIPYAGPSQGVNPDVEPGQVSHWHRYSNDRMESAVILEDDKIDCNPAETSVKIRVRRRAVFYAEKIISTMDIQSQEVGLQIVTVKAENFWRDHPGIGIGQAPLSPQDYAFLRIIMSHSNERGYVSGGRYMYDRIKSMNNLDRLKQDFRNR